MSDNTNKNGWDPKFNNRPANDSYDKNPRWDNNPVTFNTLGLMPNEAKWDLPIDKVKDMVLKFSRETIEDAKSVVLEAEPATGAVNCYLVIPEDSDHLRDSSINGDRSAIRGNITTYSPELKKFMERMCPDSARTTYADMDNKPVRAIKIDLAKFFNIVFDRDSYEYQKRNKNEGRPRMVVRLQAKYDRIDKNKFSKLICITVTKAKYNSRDNGEFKPKKAFKA